MEVFYDKRFREKLDTNPTLFPFNNGVYDLSLNIFNMIISDAISRNELFQDADMPDWK